MEEWLRDFETCRSWWLGLGVGVGVLGLLWYVAAVNCCCQVGESGEVGSGSWGMLV